jgi:hypothetical protein
MQKNCFEINGDNRVEWERLQRIDARAASGFYFQNILPQVVRYHREAAPTGSRYDLLISLMGLSPETTVLVTAFLRPQRLVIISSRNTGQYCEQALAFLAEHELLPRSAVAVRLVDAANHNELCKVLRGELAAEKGRRIVDLTGGKKIMSAVAGYTAWGLGLPVCYLESRAYNEQMRRPEPGSEEIIIYEPPS